MDDKEAAYFKALEWSREAQKALQAATKLYREQKIDDAAYLKVREDAAMAMFAFDVAERDLKYI